MDITPTLAPKSNQLNADDLITGPRTITITNVTAGSTEQPVAIHFDGDQGRPWYPGKSMRRVLAAAWGRDASQYIGRSLTLFRDPEVSYGGIRVGGVRISHMSNLDGPLSIALTVTRQKRLPYKVQPLAVATESPRDAAHAACINAGLTEAGITALCQQIGQVATLAQLPEATLAKVAAGSISPATVERCNAAASDNNQSLGENQ